MQDPQLTTSEDHFGLAWRALSGRKAARRSRYRLEPFQVESWSADDIPADIHEILLAEQAASIQYGPEWLAHFARTVAPEHHQARVFALRHQGRVMAVLPVFLVHDDRGRVRRIEALSNYYSAVCAPTLMPNGGDLALEALIADLTQKYPKMASLRLSPLAPEAPSYLSIQRALAGSGLLGFPFFAFGNWFRRTAGVRWSDYAPSLPGPLRSTLTRKGKRFAADGGRLEIIRGGLRLEAGIEAYQHVYSQSWKRAEPYPLFVPGLIRLCAANGWLRLGVAWLDERPVAAQIWIVHAGRAEIYKLAYDEALPQYSAGSLLTAALMREVLDVDSVHEVDYLIGDDRYKRDWVDQRRERWGFTAYNPRTVAGLAGIGRECFGRCLKLLGLRQGKVEESGRA